MSIKRGGSLKKRYIIGTLIGVLGSLGIVLYNGLIVRNYSIALEHVKQGEKIKVVVLADLHSFKYGSHQERLLRKIEQQQPDIIVLVGDIVDDYRPIEGVKLLLEGLCHSAPIFYVTGNHEENITELEHVKTFLRSYGVTVLEGEYAQVKVGNTKVNIGGLSDPYRSYPFQETFNELSEAISKEEGVKILLSHRPEYAELYKKGKYDLVLSGHAHGGQVRIPGWINGLYAPGQGILPKYAGGYYALNDTTHFIVSRGLAIYPTLPRVFNPPEIVSITLTGKL